MTPRISGIDDLVRGFYIIKNYPGLLEGLSDDEHSAFEISFEPQTDKESALIPSELIPVFDIPVFDDQIVLVRTSLKVELQCEATSGRGIFRSCSAEYQDLRGERAKQALVRYACLRVAENN